MGSTEMKQLAVGVKQAAAMTGLSHFTIRDKVRRGEISAIRCGRRILIRPEALEEFLAEQPVTVPARKSL